MKRKAPFLTYVYNNIDTRSHNITTYTANNNFEFSAEMHTPSYKIAAGTMENVYFNIFLFDAQNNEHDTGSICLKNYTGIIDETAIEVLKELIPATEKAIRDIHDGKQLYLYM